MKLKDILKTVGSSIISEAIPGGKMLVGLINGFLPRNKRLPDNCSGDELSSSIESLPPEKASKILERRFDVKLEEIRQGNETLRAMLEADSRSTHTTRPYIAKGSFIVVAFAIITCISTWSCGVLTKDKEIVSTVMEGWPFVLSVVGPFVTLLWAYFGILRKESQDRLQALGGNGTTGIISSVISKVLKK